MPKSKNADKGSGSEPKLLSGGNPQIPKGKGDEPVQAYIAAMPGWKRSLGERLDELIMRTVPDVHKAVKWNQPSTATKARAGPSPSVATRSTSSSSSSAGPRWIPCRQGVQARRGALPRHLRRRRPQRRPARLLDRTGKQPARREDVEPPATPLEVSIAANHSREDDQPPCRSPANGVGVRGRRG